MDEREIAVRRYVDKKVGQVLAVNRTLRKRVKGKLNFELKRFVAINRGLRSRNKKLYRLLKEAVKQRDYYAKRVRKKGGLNGIQGVNRKRRGHQEKPRPTLRR